MNPAFDRSAPGVRITLLPDENASSGEPLNLGDRLIGFTFEEILDVRVTSEELREEV